MPNSTQILAPISALTPTMDTQYFGGASQSDCSVIITARAPLTCLLISARKGKKTTLTKLLKKHYGLSLPSLQTITRNKNIIIQWAGFEQWFLISDNADYAPFYQQACAQLLSAASVVDQSQGRSTITISGPNAQAVLEKGMPVDLHKSVFTTGSCATTEIVKIAVHISQTGFDEYQISCSRSFAESLWHWACEMSLEFGYCIK